MKFNFLMVSIMLLASGAFSSKASVAESADSAYKAGNYELAVSLYEDAMKTKGVSAGLLYNMGNACVKNSEPGRAVIYYERALRLDPSSKQIRNNLAWASAKVSDANRAALKGKKGNVLPEHPGFVVRLFRWITRSVASGTWAVAAAAAFIIFCGCIAVYIFCRSVILRKVGFFAALLLLPASLLFVAFGFAAASAANRSDEGVITVHSVELLESPAESSQKCTFPLARGTKMEILSEEQGPSGAAAWYKVKLNADYIGWIKASDIEVI